MQVLITEPLSDRPCDFCLSLQDHRVYADFMIEENGRIYLLRISFDGYGCNRELEEISRMSLEDSRKLAAAVRSEDVNHPEIHELLSGYFEENKLLIWQEALQKHSLLS